jgi:microcystin degradation protein MlrC
MRILAAMLKHETNTFSPVPTDLARFRAWGLHEGEAVARAYRGTNHPLAAYLDLAEERGIEIMTPVAAEAMPSGLVQREAYEHLTGLILDALKGGGFDGAMLDLHGAMVAEPDWDGEGGLLEAMRRISPDLPIAVTLDMHGNITERVVANCTCLLGYKTYPHVDMAAVGRRAGEILLDSLEGRCRPVMAYGRLPLLAQTLRMGTADRPMGPLQAMTRDEEGRPGILAASVFGGFRWPTFPWRAFPPLWSRMATSRRPKPHATGCWSGPGRSGRSSSTGTSRSARRSGGRRASTTRPWCFSTTPTTWAPAARRIR